MAQKITIDDVRNFINEFDVDKQCELLSTEYKNINEPLRLRCNLCGEEFERSFRHIKRMRFKCLKCSNATNRGGSKLKGSIEQVREYIAQNDINHECTLISTEYVNNSTPLKLICNVCGKEFERDFNHIKRGRFRCSQCGIEAGARKVEYTREQVEQDIWDNAKYTMIGEYINAGTPVLVRCSLGHEFNLVYSHFKANHGGCKQCANLNMRGSNHPNWNGGGHQDTVDSFRHSIHSWKVACLKAANFKCDITGRTDNLVIHHLSNFSEILKQTLEDLNLPYYNTIKEYTEEERRLAEDELLRRHPIELGVVLTREVHDKFHAIYGKVNNTKEQYEEFKRTYYKDIG